MRYRKSLLGIRFGQWTVVAGTGTRNWICRCDCGVERSVCDWSLKRGASQSCGHDRARQVAQIKTTHGLSRSREYKIWGGMVNRCHNPNDKWNYRKYGARGIIVCDRWRVFENFIADMGARPSNRHSIDRINNDGNYEPSNCRWATPYEQVMNRRCMREFAA